MVMDIKKKVEKLFKKAQSAEELGSLKEAALFMAKANELLVKHELDKANLNLGEEKIKMDHEVFNVGELMGWNKTQGDWMQKLVCRIAEHNFCSGVIHPPFSYRWWDEAKGKHVTKWRAPRTTIVGERHNIEMVIYMVSNIIPTVKVLESKSWNQNRNLITEKRNTYKRGYFTGAVAGIKSKLVEQANANKAKYEGLTGLIKTNDVALRDKEKEIFGELKMTSSRVKKGTAGIINGHRDGKNITINKGLSNNSSSNSKTKLLN